MSKLLSCEHNMKKLFFVLTLLIVILVGCTENERAKKLGGSTTIELESNQKLVNVTWKEQSLWILTRNRNSDESAEEYKFRENSSWGLLEGTVTIKEKE